MGILQKSSRTKTRNRRRDVDQVYEDLRSPKHLADHKNSKPAEDLPGLGQFYCIECAKFFESAHSQLAHLKGSTHKRRVKLLKEAPYTQKEAEAAVGLRTDNGPRIEMKQNLKNADAVMEGIELSGQHIYT